MGSRMIWQDSTLFSISLGLHRSLKDTSTTARIWRALPRPSEWPATSRRRTRSCPDNWRDPATLSLLLSSSLSSLVKFLNPLAPAHPRHPFGGPVVFPGTWRELPLLLVNVVSWLLLFNWFSKPRTGLRRILMKVDNFLRTWKKQMFVSMKWDLTVSSHSQKTWESGAMFGKQL